MAAEGQVLTAAARLAQLLNLDPSLPLHATDGWVVPHPCSPILSRWASCSTLPRSSGRSWRRSRFAIREAALALSRGQDAALFPYRARRLQHNEYGGGSNLVAQPGGFGGLTGSRLGSFAQRTDTDVVLFWTAQNLGLGNCTRSSSHAASCRLRTWNCFGCSTRCAPKWLRPTPAPMPATPRSTSPSGPFAPASAAFTEDMTRVRGTPRALPIELLESFRLLSNAREQYLNAIADYNAAQFELYVALGQPPAAALARPIPAKLVPPPSSARGPESCPCTRVALDLRSLGDLGSLARTPQPWPKIEGGHGKAAKKYLETGPPDRLEGCRRNPPGFDRGLGGMWGAPGRCSPFP